MKFIFKAFLFSLFFFHNAHAGISGAQLPSQSGQSGKFLSTNGSNLSWQAGGGGGGANTSLSNLTATSINQSLLSGTGGSQVLGSTSKYWGPSFISALDDDFSVVAVDLFNRLLKDGGATNVMDFGNRALYNSTPAVALKFSGLTPVGAGTCLKDSDGTGNAIWQACGGGSTLPRLEVQAENGAGTTLANGSDTDIPFATIISNPDSAFDGLTFTAPATGLYSFSVITSPNISTASSYQIYEILDNSSNVQIQLLFQISNFSFTGINTFSPNVYLQMTSGDTAKVRIHQNSGGSGSLQAVPGNNILTIIRLQ